MLWITIKIKCLNNFLLFTNGHQKFDPRMVNFTIQMSSLEFVMKTVCKIVYINILEINDEGRTF